MMLPFRLFLTFLLFGVSLSPGEQESQASSTEQQLALLAGRVVADSGKLDLPFVTCDLMGSGAAGPDDEKRQVFIVQPTITSKGVRFDGRFQFNVKPGEYRLIGRARGRLPVVNEGIRVGAGEKRQNIVLKVVSGSSLKGLVLSRGIPKPAAFVSVEGHGFRRSTLTNEQGNFEVKGLPKGAFKVHAFAPEGGDDEKEANSGANVRLELVKRGKLFGRVVYEGGLDFPHAKVFGVAYIEDQKPDQDPAGEFIEPNLADLVGNTEATPMTARPECRELTTTDETGRFTLPVSSSERLILGAASGTDRGLLLNVKPDSREVIITVHRAPLVRLRVTNEQGKPTIAWVSIRAKETPADFFAAAVLRSSPDGLVEFVVWPEVSVELLTEGYRAKLEAINPLPAWVKIGQSLPLLPLVGSRSCGYELSH